MRNSAKSIALLSALGAGALTLVASSVMVGCSSSEASDRLTGDDPSAGSSGSLYDHQDTSSSNVTPQDRQVEQDSVGSPEVYARLHACGKLTVHSLGRILTTRGVDPAGPAYALYAGGGPAFGAANYGSRSPEVIIASTANLTKEFDVLVTAAPEMIANLGAPTGACPGVVLYDQNSFTKDGLSCLMGKTAQPEHIFLANQALADAVAQGITDNDGKAIAVATLLQAAHTCE